MHQHRNDKVLMKSVFYPKPYVSLIFLVHMSRVLVRICGEICEEFKAFIRRIHFAPEQS